MAQALHTTMALELMARVVNKQVLRIQHLFTLSFEINSNSILTRRNRHCQPLMQQTVNTSALFSM